VVCSLVATTSSCNASPVIKFLNRCCSFVTSCFPAVLGSTSNFDFPPEELDKFAKDHNLNGGSKGASTEDSDDDDYNENLVYVSSPKVRSVGVVFDSQILLHILCTSYIC